MRTVAKPQAKNRKTTSGTSTRSCLRVRESRASTTVSLAMFEFRRGNRRAYEGCVVVEDDAGGDGVHEIGEPALRVEARAEFALGENVLDLLRDATGNEDAAPRAVRQRH